MWFKWISVYGNQEKCSGRWKCKDVVSISLKELRSRDYGTIEQKLLAADGFGKIIVNAIAYEDLKVFAVACIRCMNQGKRYLFRTAAAFTKIIGGIEDQALLERSSLRNEDDRNGGLIIIGSHVQKTTRQLEVLKRKNEIAFLEFHVETVRDEEAFRKEQQEVIRQVQNNIEAGITTAVYTSRTRLDQHTGNREDDLRVSVKISEAVTGIVSSLDVRPAFIVAKGGITSSDVGTKGLLVKKALVMGQILPGIPVWLTGKESRFPDMPYVIFPGNVGSDDSSFVTGECIVVSGGSYM